MPLRLLLLRLLLVAGSSFLRRSGARLDLREAGLQILVLGLELLELVLHVLVLLLLAAEVANDLADTTANAGVEIDLGTRAQRGTRLRIAEIAERADDVDAQHRIRILDEV